MLNKEKLFSDCNYRVTLAKLLLVNRMVQVHIYFAAGAYCEDRIMKY